MKRIILFRFHRNPTVCKNRLEILKKINPGIKIFGLFDYKRKYKKFRKLDNYFENVYFIEDKTNKWFWKNGDLALRMWYKGFGKNISFDMLHVIEWDLLILDSLDNVYGKIPKNGMGLTALRDLKGIEKRWTWTSKEPSKSQWKKLLQFVKKEFKYDKTPYGSLGPGACLPKKFLKRYANVEVPELCNDELRLPLFGQVFGFKLYNTSFYSKRWFDRRQFKYFNCRGLEVELSTITNELKKPSGRRVFHPFRKKLSLKLLDNL